MSVDNTSPSKSFHLSNKELQLILDALDVLRRDPQFPLSELEDLASLSSKLLDWLRIMKVDLDLHTMIKNAKLEYQESPTIEDDTGNRSLGKNKDKSQIAKT